MSDEAPLAPPTGDTKTEIFSLEQGTIVFRYPARITPDDLKNISEWLPIMHRKLMRAADPVVAAKPTAASEGAGT